MGLQPAQELAMARGYSRIILKAAFVAVLGAGLACFSGCAGNERNSTDRDPACPMGSGCAGTGGTGGTGGVSGVGGTGGAGGTGGVSGMAGIGAGGGVGGTAGTGGTAGAGGSAGTGGTGGVAGSGGMDGNAGQGGDDAVGGTGGAMASAGCQATEWPESGTYTLEVDGTEREYIVALPDGYDSSEPYKLVFAWHYLGGTASGIARSGYYGLERRSQGGTIFVAAQGIDNAWPNTGGRDVAFTRAMLDFMRSSYCIDDDRIFSTGFSYGGIMSNTVGCQLGDEFRAIAPMSGSGPRSFRGTSCTGQVAAWISHGNSDTVVSFSSGEGSRDHWVSANGCGSETTPVGECVAYEGCDDGYPVHWCEYSGGHTQPRFAPDAIWEFFSQF